MLNGQSNVSASSGLVGASLNPPHTQVTISQTDNGYIISKHYGQKTKVALSLDDMVEVVKEFFEDEAE